MLNNDKTELLVLHARHRPQPPLDSIHIGSDVIPVSSSAKNIGVWFDDVMSMDKQINSICKSAFYHLRNIAKVAKFISSRHCEILVHAFVTSKLDYCNTLLTGLRQDQIKKLQYVQNAAARLLTGSRKHDHITPLLKDLHWLPVSERINFKILLLTFKSINSLAPKYLSDLLTLYRPPRALRSANKSLLVQPRFNLKTYGQRAFSVIAPKLWNALPPDNRTCTCLDTFKAKLKTHLFSTVFNL